MGMKKTILPWIVLGGGLTGLTIAIFLQWYVNSPHTQSCGVVCLVRLSAEYLGQAVLVGAAQRADYV